MSMKTKTFSFRASFINDHLSEANDVILLYNLHLPLFSFFPFSSNYLSDARSLEVVVDCQRHDVLRLHSLKSSQID